jgi:hypothetical protein
VITAVSTILQSTISKNPAQYVFNFDEEENAGGITVNQLRNALFKVVKGKDKTKHIAVGSGKEFLSQYHKKHWLFDAKAGVVKPLKR